MYDYIVAGGGSAGCILANRLSEDPAVKVLLVEAGGKDLSPLYSMPAGFAKMTKGTNSWGYFTEPQKHLKGRRLKFTQGKVLGGGSSVNAQVYIRGARQDYDDWSSECGAHGWSYQEVLPYFRKAEDNARFSNEYHGVEGPLGVSNPISPLPICEAFFKAGQEMGVPFNHDFNGAKQDGFGYYQLTQRNARRSSTSVAYLRPALTRPNLTLKTGVMVTKLLIENKRAVGIEFANGGNIEKEYSSREVILSSGSFGSPKLLMLSGIGPADHLREKGITVVEDVPGVGENLQDHLDLFAISECTGDHTYDKYASPINAVKAGLQYLLYKNGPVASSLFETGGFWYADESARSPDIQFHLGLGSGIEAGVEQMKESGVTLNSAFMRPLSRGTVRLASNNPRAAPLIDPNYWNDPYDKRMAIKGLRLAIDVLGHSAMSRYVKRNVLPGSDCKSDDDLFDYACRTAKTDHHPVGTCRMGSDNNSVVDTELRVRALSGLRVVDASVMPRLVSGNTNAPTIMIAEKAADLIKSTSSG